MPTRRRRSESSAPGAGRYQRRKREEEAEPEEVEENDDFEDPEDDFEEPPRRRSRRPRDEDDEDDRPRRSRSRRDDDDDDEDEAPRRRSRRSSRDDDEEEEKLRRRGRSRDDDDDEDHVIGSGWDDTKEFKSGFPGKDDKISLNKDGIGVLGLFLEDAPFSVYYRHWVGGSNGRGYTCLGKRKCPLCRVGHEPVQRAAFNFGVLGEIDSRGDFDPYEQLEVKIYDASPTVTTDLKKINDNPRKGPLTKDYYEITAKKKAGRGGKGFTTHLFDRVREDELEESFEVDIVTDEDLEGLKLWTPKDHPYQNKLEDLEEAAEGLTDDGDDEDYDRPRRSRRDEDDDDDRSRRRSRRR